MTSLRMALCDLRHETLGTHSIYAPVGIGYIGSYLKSQQPNIEFDIRLYTRPSEILDDINIWSPDVVALSSYLWNSSLSNCVCEYAKEANKDILCVLGGPEFPAGTGQMDISLNADLCQKYLQERPSVDYYCYSDGETALVSIIEAFVKADCSVEKLKLTGFPVGGTCAINPQTKKIIIGKPLPRIGLGNKVGGRDIIPSPYTSGMMDKFLNRHFIPSLETQRGCPFSCTFCDQGLDTNKIVSFSVERICEELSYIAEKVGKLKGARTLALHDSNFGMYQHDLEIAKHLLTLMETYDWPKQVEISTPKNKAEKILEIDSLLKNRVDVGLSQQSMNRATLIEIKRSNYSNEKYMEFVKELQARGKPVSCELIIPLPGETEQTYHDSTRLLTENGITLGTYTLMMLRGSELGRSESRDKFAMKTKFRVLPRQFGEYGGKRILEVEEVCVETATMPFGSYCRSRRFSFIIAIFSSNIFDPLRRHIVELGVSYYDFMNLVYRDLEESSGSSPLHEIYKGFSFESEAELFDSRESLHSFYCQDDHFEQLLRGELGDNLLRKYSTKALFHLELLVDLSYDLICKHFGKSFSNDNISTIEAVRSWLKNRTFIREMRRNETDECNGQRLVQFSFDVPSWYIDKGRELKDFRSDVTYSFTSKYPELKDELSGLFGDDPEYQFGKILHTRPITYFFCECERLE